MIIFYTTIFVLFVLGTSIGSFINAAVYRIKNNKSLIFDRSHCTKCKKQLSYIELIPIFSFLLQNGKCKHCGTQISPHYLLFELFFGVYLASLGIFLDNGTFDITQFILYSLIGVSLMILSISDILYLEIPDEVHPINIILGILIAYSFGNNLYISLISGFLAGFAFFLVFRLTGGNKMGFGDVKLAFGLGTIFNILLFILLVMISSFFGIIYGFIQAKMTNGKINEIKVPYGAVLSITSLMFIIFSYTSVGQSFLSLYDFLEYLF